MKYFLGLLLVALGGALGKKASEKYETRREVFDSLSVTNSVITAETAYEKELSDILDELPEELKESFDGAKSVIKGERFVCRNKRLQPRQRRLIERYVELLGTTGKAGQKELLSTFAESIEAERRSAREAAKKAEGVGLRLGVAAGLVAFVLIA